MWKDEAIIAKVCKSCHEFTLLEFGIAEKTIKQHRGHVVDKMAAQSLADLVLMAERLGARPSGADFANAKGKLTSCKCRYT